MRHGDAPLALWLATDPAPRHEADCEELRRAALQRRSVRQRAGRAVIALGERLAGEPRPVVGRRLARPVS